MRLIDADALLKEVENEQKYLIARGQLSEEHILVHALKRPVLDAPTIDAVEVVRCEYCRWGKEVCGNIECFVDMNVPPEYHGYEWFCPNGERRKDETD